MVSMNAGMAMPSGPTVTLDTSHIRNREFGRHIPINRDRARAVMEELGLDGLIALSPRNVYYLTNTTPNLIAFGAEFPAFATFPRDPDQPTFLISSALNTWETSTADREVPQVIAMSGAANWQDYVGASPEQMRIEPESAGKNPLSNIYPGATLSPREAAWKRAQETYNPVSVGSPEWAIVRALKQSGLINGRIAVDDMRIAYLLQRIGIDSVTIVPGDNVFRKIRHIKTDYEVELMRVAQRITQESSMAAARSLEEGMTYDEFRLRFFTEATARGGEPGFMLLGVSLGLLPDEVVKRGRMYMMDCSVHFKKYHGDFARTISVGEPSAESMKWFKAQQIARAEAFDMIKPGVSFQQVEQAAREAAIKAGMPKELPAFGMHSVGLQHDDDPGRMDVPFAARDDLVLAENMVVTLDLPFIQIGWGAGHNEDMLRITKTGYEILNDPADPLVVV